MKKNIFLLVMIFAITTTGLFADVFIKDLTEIKTVELVGKGKAGKSNIPALRQSDAYEMAKKSAQKELSNYIKAIKNSKGTTLEELAQTSTPVQFIFAETLKESPITFKEWDKEDNATIKIEVNLIKLKEKLNKLGEE